LDALAPALEYAEKGFVLTGFRWGSLQQQSAAIAAEPTAAALYLSADGSVPAAGAVIRQPDLARTLRRLSTSGPDDFYTGELAQRIAQDMTQNGGWITLADLRSLPDPRILPALHGTYRGLDVYTLPPPYGGYAVLVALNLLERVPVELLRSDDEARHIWVAEALRWAHSMRRHDPVPDVLNYEAGVAERIDKARALARADSLGLGETTHFTVVDGAGMVVAVTQSLNSYYGARVGPPGLGFLYNDYMIELETGRPDHPFALRPGAMPLSSMSATIVSRRGQPQLALGSPGSARIISAVVQVIHGYVDRGLTLSEAVAAPRIHALPGEDRDRVFLEGVAWSESLKATLLERGLRIADPGSELVGSGSGGSWFDPYFGGVHAVAGRNAVLEGAADPRRDGVAR
jgi:gamma-glutamyltranspeptidase/glutathione hydrolase